MFNKIEISLWRAVFWPVANLSYWALIFLSWWDTRVKVFFGFSVIQKILELRNVSSVRQYFGELEGEAYRAVAEHGSIAGDFIIIPLIMAVVMFIVPFIVRRDHGRPVTGYVVLPAMTLLCYFFASFLNLILVVAMSAGIHYLLFKVPGPDICMFMVHPLYLVYPVFRSIPGFVSQCLYLAFIGTVLCTESAVAAERAEGYDYGGDDEAINNEGGEDDWDRSACLMEMDRFSRILNAKFSSPTFVERLREDVASYINTPGQVKDEVSGGSSHYKIVLSATKESLRSILDENPKTLRGRDVFSFIVDEMARMEYISEENAVRMKLSMGIAPFAKKRVINVEAPPAEPPVAYPARPTEVHWDSQRYSEIPRRSEPEETQPEPTTEPAMEPTAMEPTTTEPTTAESLNEQWWNELEDSSPSEPEDPPPWLLT